MPDTKTVTAAMVTEAVMRGVAAAGVFKDFFYKHENGLFSYLATQARLRVLEIIAVQAVAEATERPIAEVIKIKKAADLGAAIHLATIGTVTPEEAFLIFGLTPEDHELVKKAAEAAHQKVSKEELKAATAEIKEYLLKKEARVP